MGEEQHVALYSKPLHFAIIGAEVSEQLCGMVGMPSTPGTHGPMPDPAPSATVACLCYWFNPERSGEEEVSTQQFRHFHPETRTHLCLSVS